ncbi:MAG: AI-2E family transporter [archaeon]
MKDLYHKYGPLVALLLVGFLCYLVLKPFIFSFLTAALLACMFYPIFKFIRVRIKSDTAASVLVVLLVFLLIIVPSIFISVTLMAEIPKMYTVTLKALQNTEMINQALQNIEINTGININLRTVIGTVASKILSFLQKFVTTLPSKTLNIVLSAFFVFFFLKEGTKIIDKLTYILPFGRKNSRRLFDEMNKLIGAVVAGQVVTATVQAIIATMAFYVLGINGALFFGVLTLILAMIPMVGAIFVYLPLGLSLILPVFFNGEGNVLKGVFLLAFGFGVISSVDNIVKPMIISDKLNMHPVLALISVIGGLAAFGIIGMVLGPLCITVLIALSNIYELKGESLETKKTAK